MNSTPNQLRHTSIRRKALTLIEVLVVMAIILILMGLFIVGLKQWGDSAKRNTTMTRLESLNGMLSNLDAVGHNQFLTQWFFTQTQPSYSLAANAAAFGNVTTDVQQGATYTITTSTVPVLATSNRQLAVAYLTYPATSAPVTTTASPLPLALPAPFAAPPVLYVLSNVSGPLAIYGIMSKLASLPDNAKIMAGFPANAVASVAPSVAPANVITTPNYATNYIALPVVLDGWGNPILFCPSGGLVNVCVNVKGTVSPQPPLVITSPDGRPFWASAGPDGDFVKGDDNIYSFQQQ